MAKITFTRTKNALNLIGENIKSNVQFQLQQDNINASGRTSASIKHTVKERGAIISMEMMGRKVRGYDVLGIIDKGRGMGLPPPYKEIAKWIKQKNIPINSGKRGQKDIKRVAYAIAQAIGMGQSRNALPPQFSIRGRSIFDRALMGRQEVYGNQIAEAFAEDVNEYLEDNMPKGNTRVT